MQNERKQKRCQLYKPIYSAILMHLARQHDLGGKTDFDTAEINAIGLLYQDFVRECVLYLQISTGRREGDKASFFQNKQNF